MYYCTMTATPLPLPSDDDDAPKPEDNLLLLDDSPDLRPLLSELGIIEIERGICEDTFENRKIIREAKLSYNPVYTTNGVPSGLIMAVSKDTAMINRMTSLAQRKPILVKRDDLNSDFLTGLDLLAEADAYVIAPQWVIGATKMWVAEQENPIASETRKPTALPHRCNQIKSDNIRCMLWSSGRPKDGGLCRVHLRYINHRPGDDIDRARKKLVQAAPYAVDVLEELMTSAASEPVRLKASTEILDRAGVRAGTESDLNVNVTVDRPAKDIIVERIQQIQKNALAAAERGLAAGVEEITDAELVTITDEERADSE